MILKAFALLDTKVSAFHTPFFMAHVGHAIRACGELGADLSTTIGRHPADFHLYEIGSFDDATGRFSAYDVLVSHGPVLAFVPRRDSATPLLDVLPEQGPVVSTASNGRGYFPEVRRTPPARSAFHDDGNQGA